jgi:hypothetical protein
MVHNQLLIVCAIEILDNSVLIILILFFLTVHDLLYASTTATILAFFSNKLFFKVFVSSYSYT